MRLSMHSDAGLMDITKITADGDTLVFTGTICGSVPIQTVLRPAELRRAFSLLGFKTILAAIWIMLVR